MILSCALDVRPDASGIPSQTRSGVADGHAQLGPAWVRMSMGSAHVFAAQGGGKQAIKMGAKKTLTAIP